MARTDIHSPTNFDSAQYEYVGSFDAFPEPGAFCASTNLATDARAEHQTPFGTVVGAFTWEHACYMAARLLLREKGANIYGAASCQCDHCGAHIRYHAIFRHSSGEHIAVGDTCATERFGCSSRREYDIRLLKEAAASARERERAMTTAVVFIRDAAPELEEWMLTLAARAVHPIFFEMSTKLVKYGALSERQIAFARRLLQEHFERQRNGGKTDREVVREAERAVLPDCPEGRVEITGAVVKKSEHYSDFGFSWKMTVRDDRGFAVWMTCPDSIENDVEVGTRVAVIATVTRSERDAKFGFGKRPSKARVIGQPAAEQVAA